MPLEPACLLPDLVTPDLILRRFSIGDSDAVWRLSQEDGIRTWMPDQVYGDPTEAAEVLRGLIGGYALPDRPDPARGPLVLAAVLRDTAELVGHVGLSPLGDEIEVGYAIGERHQGRGLATQAVSGLCGWALDNLGLARIYGVVASANRGSARVLDKAGFVLEHEGPRPYLGAVRTCRVYRRDRPHR